MGNLNSRLKSFGWKVIEIDNGNDIQSIIERMDQAKNNLFSNKPVIVLLKTIMGNGVDFMMHTHEWHGKAPNDEQLELALKQNTETLGDY
jgi:transketolase